MHFADLKYMYRSGLWNPALHCCTWMFQVQIRFKGFACLQSSHCRESDHSRIISLLRPAKHWLLLRTTWKPSTFEKQLGAFPPSCSFAAGSTNCIELSPNQIAGSWSAQLQQRQWDNWTLFANASTYTHYDPPWSTYLACQPYADDSATSSWSLRSKQVQIFSTPLLYRVSSTSENKQRLLASSLRYEGRSTITQLDTAVWIWGSSLAFSAISWPCRHLATKRWPRNA
jgi:hypothetical protein